MENTLSVNSVIEKFPRSVLCDMTNMTMLQNNVPESRSGKEKYAETIIEEVMNEGIQTLVKRMKKPLLTECTKKVPDKILNKGNPSTSSTTVAVMSKRLKELMVELGVSEFLSKYVNKKDVLLNCLSLCDLVPEKGTSVQELIVMLDTEVSQLGMWQFFDRFTVHDLHYFASKMDLTIESNNKKTLISCITTNSDFIDEDKDNEKQRKKPQITNATKYDLVSLFDTEDLIQFCEKNGLKKDSTDHNELAQIIVDYLFAKKNEKKAKTLKPGFSPMKFSTRVREPPSRIAKSKKSKKTNNSSSEDTAELSDSDSNSEDTKDEMMKNFRSGDSSDDSDSESLDEFTNEMEKRAQIAHQNRLEKNKSENRKDTESKYR